MKVWLTQRAKDGTQFSEAGELLIKEAIKGMSEPHEQWLIRQVEVGKFDSARVCALLSGKDQFVQSVVKEYWVQVTEGGTLRKIKS
jgi:hypothetical protein